MKKGGKKINLTLVFSARGLYSAIAILLFLIAGVGVWAYNTVNPSVFGHSAEEVEGTVPSGAIMFFDLSSCPVGWTEATVARGRYLVGLQASGTLGGTVGTALSDKENRAVGLHSHGVGTLSAGNAGAHTHTVGVKDAYSTGSDDSISSNQFTADSTKSTSSAGAHAHTISGTIANAGSVAGTNAPYIQYLVCKKD